jgi:hypothetical protein
VLDDAFSPRLAVRISSAGTFRLSQLERSFGSNGINATGSTFDPAGEQHELGLKTELFGRRR